MKTPFLVFSLHILAVSALYGQLNTSHNHLRAGDVLIKQQVEYTDPGEPGKDRLWDFSKVKTVNDGYTLTYSLPPLQGDSLYILGSSRYKKTDQAAHSLIVGTEHNTMYYYRMTGDSLLQTGHENPTIQLEYTRPLVHMAYPLNYGQTIASGYRSKGLYSGTVDMQSQGTVVTTADAYGKLVLPDGDTLNPVLRVKTVQTILATDENSQDKGKALEICRWYSKGYRYPVFETVRNINLGDSTEIFSTAFFFPPQDHLYLDTDPENQKLLDELWDLENQQPDKAAEPIKEITLEDILTCKVYPNPVITTMNLEYEIKEDADVSFQLYSVTGNMVKTIRNKRRPVGKYTETMDCSGIQPGNYVLRIEANGVRGNYVIVKK